MSKTLTALGMMSGTSLDGVDAAIIRTDGETVERTGHAITCSCPEELRHHLRQLTDSKDDILADKLEKQLTEIHAEVVKDLLKEAGLQPEQVDVIGFHGQTIDHQPDKGMTWQIGDGALLAKLTGIDVVNDFRSADMAAGGQGAPLVPLYHEAMVKDELKPVVMINIGGVANITYIGDNTLLAFDTGPGNALLDDWVQGHIGKPYDDKGIAAVLGEINHSLLKQLLSHPYFKEEPPKSLDRNDFVTGILDDLSFEDGAATLTAFTAVTIAKALEFCPRVPEICYVTGGGRHNNKLMADIDAETDMPVYPVEKLGYDGDAVEAEAFAFLAVRSMYELPLTLPGTTGRDPASLGAGGAFYPA